MKINLYVEVELDVSERSDYSIEYGTARRVETFFLQLPHVKDVKAIYLPAMLKADIERRFGTTYRHNGALRDPAVID